MRKAATLTGNFPSIFYALPQEGTAVDLTIEAILSSDPTEGVRGEIAKANPSIASTALNSEGDDEK